MSLRCGVPKPAVRRMTNAFLGVLLMLLCLLQSAYGLANLGPEVRDPANFLPPRILVGAETTTSIKPSRPQTLDRQATASALPQWLFREPLGESESINLYSYCHNDPINRVDVLGLWESDLGYVGDVGLFYKGIGLAGWGLVKGVGTSVLDLPSNAVTLAKGAYWNATDTNYHNAGPGVLLETAMGVKAAASNYGDRLAEGKMETLGGATFHVLSIATPFAASKFTTAAEAVNAVEVANGSRLAFSATMVDDAAAMSRTLSSGGQGLSFTSKIGVVDDIIPAANSANNLVIDAYGTLSRNGSIPGQAHHLNQTAAFRDVISRNAGQSIKLEGNILKDAGAPHTLAHQSLEGFWNGFRGTATVPTNLQYTQAMQQSLRAAGLTEAQVQQAVMAAIRERVQHGLLGGMEVPRVPGPIRNLAQ